MNQLTPTAGRTRVAQGMLPLLVLLVLMTAARSAFGNHYQVPSGSMQPTLEPGGRVVVDMRLCTSGHSWS